MVKRILCVLFAICLLFSLPSHTFAAIDMDDMSDNQITTQVRVQGATGVNFLRNQPGIVGKSSNDTIQIIDVASDASSITGTAGSYPRFEITHGLNFANNKISTFQFNIYADANVVAGFTFHWSDVLVWNADGTLQYKYYASDSEKTAIADA